MANTDLYQFTVVLINSDPIIHQLSKIPRVNSQLPIIGFLKFMHYFVFLGNMGQIKKKLHESGQQKEDINLLCCFGVAQHNVEAVDSGRVSLTGQLLILE